LGARIASIAVDSSVARKLPWSERVLPMGFPIDLARGGDFNALRIEIARMQPDIARSPHAKPKGGNSHKRIRISLYVPSNISLLVLSTILVVGETGYIVGYRPTPHKGGSSII